MNFILATVIECYRFNLFLLTLLFSEDTICYYYFHKYSRKKNLLRKFPHTKEKKTKEKSKIEISCF